MRHTARRSVPKRGELDFDDRTKTFYPMALDGAHRRTVFGEMKWPLSAALAGAGWRWRPTLWRGPRCLAWLTD